MSLDHLIEEYVKSVADYTEEREDILNFCNPERHDLEYSDPNIIVQASMRAAALANAITANAKRVLTLSALKNGAVPPSEDMKQLLNGLKFCKNTKGIEAVNTVYKKNKSALQAADIQAHPAQLKTEHLPPYTPILALLDATHDERQKLIHAYGIKLVGLENLKNTSPEFRRLCKQYLLHNAGSIFKKDPIIQKLNAMAKEEELKKCGAGVISPDTGPCVVKNGAGLFSPTQPSIVIKAILSDVPDYNHYS